VCVCNNWMDGLRYRNAYNKMNEKTCLVNDVLTTTSDEKLYTNLTRSKIRNGWPASSVHKRQQGRQSSHIMQYFGSFLLLGI
jgi:hypothetical protein